MQKEGQVREAGRRFFHIDLIRAFACLSVVMIHVSAEFVIRGTQGADFLVGNAFDSLARTGVPLFVMISGALMLDEGYQFTKKKWLGHIGRMAAFFLFWSVVYILCFRTNLFRNIVETVMSIFSGHYHLWFVPMILGLYLILPLLRLWVKEANKRYVEYFLLLAAIFAFVLPQGLELLVVKFKSFRHIKSFVDDMHMQYPLGYTAYFVLGWYLNRGIRWKKTSYVLGILGVIVTFAGTHAAATMLKMRDYPFYENFTVNVLLHSVAMFVLCKSVFENRTPSRGILSGLVRMVGKYSLGIYAVHVYFITKLLPVFGQMHALAAIPIIFVLCTAISMLISMLLHKIPLLKKIV